VSFGNVEAVTKEASTHRKLSAIGSVKNKCGALCKLMLRQAAVARKIRNCRLRERSIIAILLGPTTSPFTFLCYKTGEAK
jgi:hypothetical protein